MARRHLRFIWGAGDTIQGRWFLGLFGRYDRGRGRHTEGLAISVRGLLCWLTALALAGYLAAATALFFWFDRQPGNLIGYTDTVSLPFRWSHVRELRGRMLIQQAQSDLEAQRLGEAHLKLRVGLARDPENRDGRRMLATFYELAGRRAEALTLLTDGLAYGRPDRAYLKALFAAAAEGEEYGVIVSTCERFMPEAHEDRSWLVAQRFQALIAAGRFADVLAESEGPGASAAVREARVLALIELNRDDEALASLNRWENESDARTLPTIVRLRVRALREAGQVAAMNAEWERLRDLEPANSRTYLYGVVQKSLAGQRAESAEALEAYFRRFAASAPDLLQAANALANAGDVSLVDRCVARAAEQGFPKAAFGIVRLETQLSNGRWMEAKETMAELTPLIPLAEPAERYVGRWLERLFAVAVHADEVPAAALLAFFQERPAPLRLWRVSIEVLIRAERYEAAQAVLDLAERAYAGSETLAGLRKTITEARRSFSRDDPRDIAGAR